MTKLTDNPSLSDATASTSTEPVSGVPDIRFHAQDNSTIGLELVELSSIYTRAPNFDHNPFAAHRVHFHQLIYISEGVGQHFIDFHDYPVSAGDFLFINKNQIQAFDPINQPLGVSLIFTQQFIDSIQASVRLPVFGAGYQADSAAPVFKPDTATRQRCEVLLAELKQTGGTEPGGALVIQLLFAALLVRVHSKRPAPKGRTLSDADRQRFTEFMALVETHSVRRHDAAFYAAELHMTYKGLNDLTKKVSTRTPKQLIDAHRVLEAKRRLTIDQIQISKLAYELGFEDVSNFNKYFKKHTAMTPSQFRQSI